MSFFGSCLLLRLGWIICLAPIGQWGDFCDQQHLSPPVDGDLAHYTWGFSVFECNSTADFFQVSVGRSTKIPTIVCGLQQVAGFSHGEWYRFCLLQCTWKKEM